MMKLMRCLLVVLCLSFLSLFIVSCVKPPICRTYPGSVLQKSNTAYLIESLYGNYVESIDGITKTTIIDNNGNWCGIFEIPVGKHSIRASYWQQTRGAGGWNSFSAGGKEGLPLTFVAEPRHIYRVANAPTCPEGSWCPFVKDITDKVDVPGNYEYIYQKAQEQ
ncbi:MAG: hypothetical protein HZC44_00110 [Geobacter sp.]|nr:hypothetical protein [Geobacter sp.]